MACDMNQNKFYVHSWCFIFHMWYSFEWNPLYVYVVSSVIHQAQNITPCCIYRRAHPFGRNELTGGHELGQKNEVEGQAC